jgi:hypothetical protein
VEFGELCRVTREQRARIAVLRDADRADDDGATLMVEQALYDARILDLARMLEIAIPQHVRRDGGLDADHRAIIEDHLAAEGLDLRPR